MNRRPTHRWAPYAIAVAAVAAAFALRLSLSPYVGNRSPLILFLAAVTFAAYVGGLWPGVLATAVGLAVGEYFFVRPVARVSPDAVAAWIQIVVFVAVGTTISAVCETLHRARRRAEEEAAARRASEDALRLQSRIVDTMSEGVSVSDEDGVIVYTNPAEDRMFGYGPGELAGRHVSVQNAYPPDENSRRVADVIDTLKATGVWTGEWHNRRKDGTTFHTRSHISALRRDDGRVYWVCVQRDVTARLAAERALADSERRFREVADSIPQLAWTARPDGGITWYNRRWYEYTGATADQMADRGWQSVHDPAELPRVIESFQAAVATGEPWECTFPLRRHDGQFRWHLSRALPVRDADGRVVLWFGTNTDVTDQRNAARERDRLLDLERAARAETERASRLKDEFLANLSHELRTPLSAIYGWAQLIQAGALAGDDLQEGVDAIARNARVQAQLVDDLLDLSRIASGKLHLDPRPLDLADVVAAAVESVAPSARAKNVSIDTTLDAADPAARVTGDPQRLQQVAWNLLTNAVKFTPAGGRIRVSLHRDHAHVRLAVADTGQGIPPAFLPHLFERFRQADGSTTRRHGGLGIGLSLVRQIVELHGGHVRAASGGDNTGATFTVTLPAEPLPPATPAAPHANGDPASHPPARPAPRLAGVTILLVDDDPDARTIATRILESHGGRVATATSAAAGLDALTADPPHVLLSDIGMPDVDGYEFIRRVRALDPARGGQTPAAAFTAFARPEDQHRALAAGFQAHLAKPVTPESLVTLVAHLATSTPVA
jgi:hypothetical protein